jgi:ABC-type glycerol-3-phosphate transport system permease component
MSGDSGTARWVGVVVMVFGAVMVLAGVITYATVSSTLSDQMITVSSDAECLADKPVNGPVAAYCEALAINQHVLNATGGKTYAQLDQDDPTRETAMTGSFLQASLYTSVVAFGVAVMAIGIGIILILLGMAVHDLAGRTD